MKKCIRVTVRAAQAALVCATSVMLSSEAWAAFHLWEITQIYSNADGSVQFIEMFNSSNNEHFLDGQEIVIDVDGVSEANSFTFPANLPSSSTSGRSVLIATGPIAGVDPDYTIPANFIPIDFDTSATVSLPFSEQSDAILTYTDIPLDGISSLGIDGTIHSPAQVTNFAGNSGTLQASEPDTAYGYDVEENVIMTGAFLGTLHVGLAPWAYNYNTSAWWYVTPGPETDLQTAGGTWVWVTIVSSDHIIPVDDWVYNTAVSTWWYVLGDMANLTNGSGSWTYHYNGTL